VKNSDFLIFLLLSLVLMSCFEGTKKITSTVIYASKSGALTLKKIGGQGNGYIYCEYYSKNVKINVEKIEDDFDCFPVLETVLSFVAVWTPSSVYISRDEGRNWKLFSLCQFDASMCGYLLRDLKILKDGKMTLIASKAYESEKLTLHSYNFGKNWSVQ
jgi:hypothetical protein